MIRFFKRIWQWWDARYLQLVWSEIRWECLYKVYGDYANLVDQEYHARRRKELEEHVQEEAWLASYHEWLEGTGIYAFDDMIEAEECSDCDYRGAFNRDLVCLSDD